MSKERELLERVMSLIDYRYAPSEAITVHREIQELLAQHETVPLYTAPPTHLISAAPELLEALENWINALDNPSEWMKCRDDAKKAIAKAHGIGV